VVSKKNLLQSGKIFLLDHLSLDRACIHDTKMLVDRRFDLKKSNLPGAIDITCINQLRKRYQKAIGCRSTPVMSPAGQHGLENWLAWLNSAPDTGITNKVKYEH
jgi:hypothetical protein